MPRAQPCFTHAPALSPAPPRAARTCASRHAVAMVGEARARAAVGNAEDVGATLRRAVAGGSVGDDAPVAVFYDMRAVGRQVDALLGALPGGVHAFAVKACPVLGVLREVRALGMAMECASVGEVALAFAAGARGGDVIFDSPAKTDAHLRWVLGEGVHVNADNIGEVRRIKEIVGEGGGSVGLRVNPQMGSATIAETFTASASSKFGEPLREAREEIVAAFGEFRGLLNCVHVHVGSQGCAAGVLVSGARAAVELADEVNARWPGTVTAIDIGGGLSVDYDGDGEKVGFAEYGRLLSAEVPRLAEYRVITEFGRKVCAKAAFVAARVQHVKRAGGRTIVIGHTGADVFMRAVYAREKWWHRVEVWDRDGGAKGGEEVEVDVGGPLCFSGDLVKLGARMPLPEAGDWLVLRDAGAYTLGMLCRHTSQLMPPVYAYGEGGLRLLKKGETVEDIVRFWS